MKLPKGDELKVDDFTRRAGVGAAIPKIYGAALAAAAAADPNIVCLSADLVAATETGEFRAAFPDRFVQVGIAEANMVGIAGGMARLGDVPFIHSFCVFVTKRCYDQISMQLAYPRLNVKIVGFIPGITTKLGVTHQAIEDVALMRAMPNMTILEPSGPEQFANAVGAALSVSGPVYLRLQRVEQPPAGDMEDLPLEIGKGYVLRNGPDGVIFAAGAMVKGALSAAEELMKTGDNVTVVNMSSIKPLDSRLVVELAAAKRHVVSAENHTIVGGLGSAIAELLMESGVRCGFQRVGLADRFAEGGTTNYLFQKFGLGSDDIVKAFATVKMRFAKAGR